jgi:hypothetical protein
MELLRVICNYIKRYFFSEKDDNVVAYIWISSLDQVPEIKKSARQQGLKLRLDFSPDPCFSVEGKLGTIENLVEEHKHQGAGFSLVQQFVSN